MKVIEQQMRRAVAAGHAWRNSNTSVRPIDDVNMAVYLHGHEIAVVNNRTGFVMVNRHTLRAWPTVTTKSRLRALGASVYTKNFITYLDGMPI